VPFLLAHEAQVLPSALLILQRLYLVRWEFLLAVRPTSNVLDAKIKHHLFRHRVLVCVVFHHLLIINSVIAWDGFVLRRPRPRVSPLAVISQARVHVFGFPDVEFTFFQLKDIDVLDVHSKTRGMRVWCAGGIVRILRDFRDFLDFGESRGSLYFF